MSISITGLIGLIILVALAWYVITELVSDPKLKKILYVIVVVILVLGLLHVLGLMGGVFIIR